MRAGTSRIYVEQIEARSGLKVKAELGRPYPLWAGASGRVLLASLPRDEIIRFAGEVGEAAFTYVDPPSMNGLIAALDETRKRGYAWAFEETMRGVHTIAAPIRVSLSNVAVLSVSGPSNRFSASLMEAATAPLVESARAISSSMGHPDAVPDPGEGARP